MTLRLISALVVVSASFSAMAQEVPESPWSGKATLGYLATSGNTENSTLNSGVEVGFATGKWQHLATATAISASDNEIATAEAYGLGWKSERNLTDTDFLFGRLAWRKDRFSGYDSQFSQTVGYGRRLIHTDQARAQRGSWRRFAAVQIEYWHHRKRGDFPGRCLLQVAVQRNGRISSGFHD